MYLSDRLSIRSKVIILLLTTSILSILIIAWQGYSSAKTALNEATLNQLNTLRTAKAQQIESYFKNITNQVQGFADYKNVIDAVNEFKTAFHLADRESITDFDRKRVEKFYRETFITKLKKQSGKEHEAKHFIPTTPAATYLQFHYVVDNPNDLGTKDNLISAEKDTSYYAQVHARHHDSLRRLVNQFGFYDLFLIDHVTGDILYSVFKETDFATNLYTGPLSSSNFAQLVKSTSDTKTRNEVNFQDFDLYLPSYGSPAAFAAITIYDGFEVAGILVVQLPINELNKVLTSNNNWQDSGMGETGEVFVVGRDNLMRSDSRFLKQHRKRYLGKIKDIGIPPETIQLIDQLNTTILTQPIYGETVEKAFNGKTGTGQVTDYRGVKVISSYAPFRKNGMDWAILAEMDVEEVNKPIDKFRRSVMVYASVLGIIITLLALLVANYFTRPLHTLVNALKRVSNGETDVRVENSSQDEVGVLSNSFNEMMEGIQEKEALISKKALENKMLLHNILPPHIADRMVSGENPIVDQVPNISVIYVTVTGLNTDDSPETAVLKLNKLIGEFDDTAIDTGVDKIKSIGDDYLAVCGLLTPRLDHSKRALEFSQRLLKVAANLSHEFENTIEVNIGIHSGTVYAGVIGEENFNYDIWGKTVNLAIAISAMAERGSILVGNSTYENLSDNEQFVKAKKINSKEVKNVQSWKYIDGKENA